MTSEKLTSTSTRGSMAHLPNGPLQTVLVAAFREVLGRPKDPSQPGNCTPLSEPSPADVAIYVTVPISQLGTPPFVSVQP